MSKRTHPIPTRHTSLLCPHYTLDLENATALKKKGKKKIKRKQTQNSFMHRTLQCYPSWGKELISLF